jgi:hypothetical protein
MSQLSKQDLEDLLRPQLGNDLVVKSFTSQPLTQAGDNYGSIMLAIEVSVVHGAHRTSSNNLSLVAKLVPPSGFLWKIFDPPNTVCKEINCYKLVNEEHRKLQEENHIPKDKFLDVFPKFYGARTTLSGEIGDKADQNAVILLENLKTANYRLGDRGVGFDLKHAQLVVSQLARFHALSVALKILKPEVFKNTVLKACKPQNVGFSEEELMATVPKLMEIVKIIPECDIYLDKLQKASVLGIKMQLDESLLPPREPYATLIHADFWVNNMMFCYETDENIPACVKFLDFQIVQYSSPVRDLIFFLYTSTAEGVRSENYEDLIRLYHENFTDCLKAVGCDISSFTFQSLLDEIEVFAPAEAYHILYMLLPICADRGNVPELSGVSFETIYRKPNNIYKRKAKEFITEFVQRGWL